MNKIKVAICDDLKQIRDYFSSIVNSRDDMIVVGTASNVQEAVKLSNETPIDIMLMDIQMEEEYSGVDATKLILANHPNIKIVIITIHEESEYIMEAYAAGAVDFIIKSEAKNELCDSIIKVYNGTEFIRPYVAKKLLTEFSKLNQQKKSFLYTIEMLSKLTKNELEILKALYFGKNRKQIAIQRHVELGTIKFHVRNILKKLRYTSSKELVKDLKEMKIFDNFYKE